MGTLEINLLNPVLTAGTYQLATAASITGGANVGNWTIAGGDSFHSETLSVVGGIAVLDLIVSNNGLVWTGVPGGGASGDPAGSTAGQWDVGTSNNFVTTGGAATTYANGAGVTFGDTYTVTGGDTGAAHQRHGDDPNRRRASGPGYVQQ